MHTPPPQDEERSFLITLKFVRDIAESGIVEESQVSVVHTMSIWLMETTTLSAHDCNFSTWKAESPFLDLGYHR
jgi:hypothetical protein